MPPGLTLFLVQIAKALQHSKEEDSKIANIKQKIEYKTHKKLPKLLNQTAIACYHAAIFNTSIKMTAKSFIFFMGTSMTCSR